METERMHEVIVAFKYYRGCNKQRPKKDIPL